MSKKRVTKLKNRRMVHNKKETTALKATQMRQGSLAITIDPRKVTKRTKMMRMKVMKKVKWNRKSYLKTRRHLKKYCSMKNRMKKVGKAKEKVIRRKLVHLRLVVLEVQKKVSKLMINFRAVTARKSKRANSTDPEIILTTI